MCKYGDLGLSIVVIIFQTGKVFLKNNRKAVNRLTNDKTRFRKKILENSTLNLKLQNETQMSNNNSMRRLT